MTSEAFCHSVKSMNTNEFSRKDVNNLDKIDNNQTRKKLNDQF
jgi:hypothetical protein